MPFHRQCKLTKPTESGVCETTSWIPEEYATVGRVVKLKNAGEWSGGWVVSEVYDRMPSEEAMRRSRDYKKNRKTSDI